MDLFLFESCKISWVNRRYKVYHNIYYSFNWVGLLAFHRYTLHSLPLVIRQPVFLDQNLCSRIFEE